MKREILFLTDGSQFEAVAYCCLCYYAQTTKTSLTVVLPGKGYHDRIVDVFKADTEVVFVSSLHTSLDYCTTYELDQLDVQFTTIHNLCRKLNIDEDVEFAATDLASDSSYYMPSVVVNMLRHRMGLEDFGNFVAQKWLENGTKWSITRDADVLDMIDPVEDADDSLS